MGVGTITFERKRHCIGGDTCKGEDVQTKRYKKKNIFTPKNESKEGKND